MYARTVTVETAPERLDDLRATVEREVLPVLRQQSGFRGATFMVDRSKGRFVGLSYFDSTEDLLRSEQELVEVRQRVSSTAQAQPVVDFYEVLIDIEI